MIQSLSLVFREIFADLKSGSYEQDAQIIWMNVVSCSKEDDTNMHFAKALEKSVIR